MEVIFYAEDCFGSSALPAAERLRRVSGGGEGGDGGPAGAGGEEERAVLNMDRPDYDPNEYSIQVDNLSKEYFLYDLDWDGVPELVIRSDFYRADIRVLTSCDGAAVEVGRLSGRYMAFFTSPDQPGLIVQEIPKGITAWRTWFRGRRISGAAGPWRSGRSTRP